MNCITTVIKDHNCTFFIGDSELDSFSPQLCDTGIQQMIS